MIFNNKLKIFKFSNFQKIKQISTTTPPAPPQLQKNVLQKEKKGLTFVLKKRLFFVQILTSSINLLSLYLFLLSFFPFSFNNEINVVEINFSVSI